MILFLSAVFLLFTSLLGDKSLFQLHRMQGEKESWTRENARQVQENLRLKEKILAARDDLFVVEKIAREDLGLVKENEVVYLFDPATVESLDRSASGTPKPIGSRQRD